MNVVITSLRNLFIMTLLFGVLYPLAVTVIGGAIFPFKSGGSLLRSGDQIIGSELIAQKFEDPKYFAPRSSAIDFKPESSGATQKSATSSDLKESYEERAKALGEQAPSDLLWASGSGLDPHISVESALFQAQKVANSRNLRLEEVTKLVKFVAEERFLGFMGQPRVNVLRLNQLLNKSHQR